MSVEPPARREHARRRRRACAKRSREAARQLPGRRVASTPVYDQAALVDESMRSVRDAILIGIALCVAVIALFLRDLRAGLVAALAVPAHPRHDLRPARARSARA